MEYCFLVEDTTIENASFQYKNVKSEANVKTNAVMRTEWTCHNKQSFASNCFMFLKILF